jgi:hypothetical protein
MVKIIKDFFERRRVRKLFSKYVSPSVVDDLLSGKINSPKAGEFNEKMLGVVLILVEYSTPKVVAKNIGMIFDLAKEHEATYEATTNGLIVFSFGKFRSERNSEASRRAFVEALRAKSERSVKIVRGTGTGQVGLVGNEQLMSYTLLMPKFGDALQSLSSLNYGETKETAFS